MTPTASSSPSGPAAVVTAPAGHGYLSLSLPGGNVTVATSPTAIAAIVAAVALAAGVPAGSVAVLSITDTFSGAVGAWDGAAFVAPAPAVNRRVLAVNAGSQTWAYAVDVDASSSACACVCCCCSLRLRALVRVIVYARRRPLLPACSACAT